MIRRPHNILILFFLAFLAYSCGGGEPKQGEEEESISKTPFHENPAMDSCLVIGHMVEDYATWKAAYDLAGPVREKHGIQTLMVLQGFSDQQMAMVVTRVSNFDKAHSYITSENLMQNMEIAGVAGEMDVYWLKHHLEADNPSKRECIVYMSFKVSDFDAWKKAFLSDYEEEPVKSFDVLHVFQSIENKNEVSMIFAADSPKFVEQMQANTSFRMKMLASGVISYPKTFILRQKEV